jgi:NAD(P)H-hydrate epimerase
MIPILSRAQMRAFDGHAITACRVPSLVLMENAGRGAADVIEKELCAGSALGARVVVVCGTGNNGGDGFVVARHLATRGARVDAWLAGDVARTTADCRANHDAFAGIGGTITIVPLDGAQSSLDALAGAIAGADVVVDALFGTGLDREIGAPLAGVVDVMNRRGHARVAALDVPSGLDADTGRAMGATVEADITVSFAHLKLGHVTNIGARLSGPVHVVDIGVPSALVEDRSASLASADDVRPRIEKRATDTHKYREGHVAILAGSPGKVGAALLAATSALRGGAGASTIVTWSDSAAVLEGKIAEVMVTSLGASASGPAAAPDAIRHRVAELLSGKRAVVMGPGFGTHPSARIVTDHVFATHRGPIVVDGDAFSLHAGTPEDFAKALGSLVLTPHSGEIGRLLGRSSEAVEHDRFGAAREAAQRANAVVLLKGAYSIIAGPDGRIVVTGSGSPALATAGSGDVLAGLIGALACKLPPFEAAWCGAFLHGVSGAAWQKEHGDRGLLASEIADGLPGVLAALLAG